MNDRIDEKSSATITVSFLKSMLVFMGLLILVFCFWMLMDLLTPIFIGLLLALIFSPVMKWLKLKLKFPTWLSLSLLMLMLVGTIAGLLIWLMPVLVGQVSGFIKSTPGYIETVVNKVSGQEFKFNEEMSQQFSELAKEPEKFAPFLLKGSVKSFGILANTFNIATYFIIYISLLIVFFVTFCLYLPGMKKWLWQFVPVSRRKSMSETGGKIYQSSATFLRTRLIIAFILGVMFSVGWAICGVPYWLMLGVATGVLSIIPYASGFGWLVALLVNGLEVGAPDELLWALLLPTIVFAVAQIVEGWILTPVIQGEKLNVHPVTVLFAVLAGGVLFGLMGMLFAIPLVAAIQILFSDIVKPKLLDWANEN